MPYLVDIEVVSQSTHVPEAADMMHWVSAALDAAAENSTAINEDAEISIYVVDENESQALNLEYRGKDKPTNVLSFLADIPEEVGIPLLGDLVVCAPIVEHEAAEQNKALSAHWAHMLVHGALHLLGYDHIEDAEAEAMEDLETRIIVQLGFPAPYTDATH
jgi:probable rRNA maturation factor